MARHPTSSATLDESERAWWSENGEIEDQYCWVQTPVEQRVLRGRYLKRMLREIPSGSRVLELGCGTGWFCLLLAERGVAVIGSDFSPDQLQRARRAAAERGLGSSTTFVPDEELDADERRFDVVVMHAFLHHLATGEITEALERAHRLLVPGGRLLVVEPVHDPGGRERGPLELQVLRRMELLPRMLAGRGFRNQGSAEDGVRDRLGRRTAAEPPFGPSPKELPFAPGELEDLLSGPFCVDRSEAVLCYSHLVAQEYLVAGLSQPRAWSGARKVLLHLAALLDHRVVTRRPLPSTAWVFILLTCRKAS